MGGEGNMIRLCVADSVGGRGLPHDMALDGN